MRSTLTAFTAVVQSFVDEGKLPQNVIALVERPPDDIINDLADEDEDIHTRSWTAPLDLTQTLVVDTTGPVDCSRLADRIQLTASPVDSGHTPAQA